MNEHPLLTKFRNEVLKRGTSGIKQIGQFFRRMDKDRSHCLCFDEFAQGVLEHNIKITADEANELFKLFDRDQSGKLDYQEFLIKIRPPLNKLRISLIMKAFQRMDKNGDGVITIEDLQGVYRVDKHPKYLSGEMTEAQIFRKFLDTFDASSHKDGIVTFDEFLDYYAGVSASIDADIYFDCMMRQCWKI